MFKEILGNILKHADAKNVSIEIKETARYLILSIRDDGKGFNTSECYDGMGLKNLKLRASEIASSVEILSEPELGTYVILRINLKKLRDAGFNFTNLLNMLSRNGGKNGTTKQNRNRN